MTLITGHAREKLWNFLYLSTKTSHKDWNPCPFTAIYSITYQQRLQGCFVFFLFSFGYCISQRLWLWILIDQNSDRNSEAICFSNPDKFKVWHFLAFSSFQSEFWSEKQLRLWLWSLTSECLKNSDAICFSNLIPKLKFGIFPVS